MTPRRGRRAMPLHFDPTLVNDPFDDPGFTSISFSNGARCFSILATSPACSSQAPARQRRLCHTSAYGPLSPVSTKFAEAPSWREKILGVYGPTGLIDASRTSSRHILGILLSALTAIWFPRNGDRRGRVPDIGAVLRAYAFERSEGGTRQSDEGLLLKEPASRFARPSSIMACPCSLSPSKSGLKSTCVATRWSDGARHRALASRLQGGDASRRA